MSGPFFATIDGCLARVGNDGGRKQIQVRLQVGPKLIFFSHALRNSALSAIVT